MSGNFNRVSTNEKIDLLFLHGYLSCGKSFSYQFPFFREHFNVYAPDLKGFGDNGDMAYPYSLTDYANEVKEYIYTNGIKKPCVIAHSFGGRVAIKLLSENPDIFTKLVLTGSAGLKPKNTLKKRAKRAVFNTLKVFVDKSRLQRFYSKDYRNLSPVMKESFKLIVNEHLDDVVDKITIPTLIINGRKDRETPVYMAKKLHKKIAQSKMIIIEDAGHFCFIDKKIKFNTEVKEFLLS